jgi:fumarate hydratase, class I
MRVEFGIEGCIKRVELAGDTGLDNKPIWRIESENFPAFIIIDDKGNDFFKELNLG